MAVWIIMSVVAPPNASTRCTRQGIASVCRCVAETLLSFQQFWMLFDGAHTYHLDHLDLPIPIASQPFNKVVSSH